MTALPIVEFPETVTAVPTEEMEYEETMTAVPKV